MDHFKKILICFVISLLITPAAFETPLYADNVSLNQKVGNQILRASRELMLFDIYWMGIYVGRASFEAINNKGNTTIVSRVSSAPVISTFYKVEDHAKSELANGKPVSFKIKQHEGRYRSNKETIFDNNNKKITYYNHLKGEKIEHNAVYNPSWDIISGFYYLRTFSFEVGKTLYISIFDSNKFYNAEVRVIGKEKILISDNWETNTIIIKPILQSEGLFMRKGDILIWLTDDENRIPVKVETTVSLGKVTAKIKSIETVK